MIEIADEIFPSRLAVSEMERIDEQSIQLDWVGGARCLAEGGHQWYYVGPLKRSVPLGFQLVKCVHCGCVALARYKQSYQNDVLHGAPYQTAVDMAAEAVLEDLCVLEQLNVNHESDGYFVIWPAHKFGSCGNGRSIAEACRSFVLHNPNMVTERFRRAVASLAPSACSHEYGYPMGFYYPAASTSESSCVRHCYSCGQPVPESTENKEGM